MRYQNAELHNIAEIIDLSEGKTPTRIPDALRVTLNSSAQAMALCPAGSEIRFAVREGAAKVILKCEAGAYGLAEVWQGDFLSTWAWLGPDPREVSVTLPQNLTSLKELAKKEKMPFDPALTRIILWQQCAVRLLGIEGEITPPGPAQTPSKRYLAYGSSITHGAQGLRPTGSYAMQTARSLGVDLINLGFGGGAHLEPQLADYIAQRQDWDFASLELGINIRTIEPDEFKMRVEYFIPRIARAHPDKWIFCTDMFLFREDFFPSSEAHHTFRKIVRDTVEALRMPRVVHLDGREILTEAAGLCADLVHPCPSGMATMANHLAGFIKKTMSLAA